MSGTGRIGVDIGGTFTDVVLVTGEGRSVVRKVSSTPANPEEAVIAGIRAVLDDARVHPAQIASVLHGTTVGSNAILQRRGGRTGLITTKGFRDVLEIGRLRTPGMFDLTWEKPEPLVPRRLRREVPERIGADGSVVLPLDTDALLEVGAFFEAEGVESVAVCFLNSYLNPEHELAAAGVLGKAHPGLSVTTSVSVLPEQREYERTSTTVVNAYVLPVLRDYLGRLRDSLEAMGIAGPLFVTNSNGGLARAALAQEKPVFFISSGRAAGAVGAAQAGRQLGEHDIVAFDMGGTTASASLVQNGEPTRTTEYEFRAGISTPSRFIKAGGYLMRVPTVDVAEIGNGAGSIAYVDDGGLICVGPVSAGADPGPACYGQGGVHPTVTDANLVLGYLPDRLAGGALRLDVEKARAAIERDIAVPLALSVDQAALGIRTIANANMARAIRVVTVERGLDPRDFTLLAFGGSGPNHACDLARMLGIPRVLFPPAPGVFTAVGMLSGAVEHFFIRSLHKPLTGLGVEELRDVTASLAGEAVRELGAEGYGRDEVGLDFAIGLRFEGQDSELHVRFDPDRPAEELPELRDRFLDLYREVYGFVSSDAVEVASIRLTATGALSGPPLRHRSSGGPAGPAGQGAVTRTIRFNGDDDPVSVPVLLREAVAGTQPGPLAIESADTTIVIPPGARARTDPSGNLMVTFDA